MRPGDQSLAALQESEEGHERSYLPVFDRDRVTPNFRHCLSLETLPHPQRLHWRDMRVLQFLYGHSIAVRGTHV